jgi:hypothetical protein
MTKSLNFFQNTSKHGFNMLDFCRHAPLEFQRKKPVHGFVTIDGKPGDSVSEACNDDFIPEKKEFAFVHWHSAVNVMKLHWWSSQWICCLDLFLKPVLGPSTVIRILGLDG